MALKFVEELQPEKHPAQGEQVELRVQVEGIHSNELRWYHNGNSVDHSSGTTERQDGDDGISILTIKDASEDTSGKYICRAGGKVVTSCLVDVQNVPARVLGERFRQVTVKKGGKLELEVQFTGSKPTHAWEHNGSTQNDDWKVRENIRRPGCFLTIPQTNTRHAGKYIFTVENQQGKDQIEFAVIVQDSVFTKKLPLEEIVDRGNQVQLKVTLSEAALKVEWYHDGRHLTNLNEGFELTNPGSGDHVLTIREVDENHAGVYVCKAVTADKKTQKTRCRLYVRGVSPSLRIRNNQTTHTVKEWETLKLSVTVKGLPCKFSWFHDGKTIESKHGIHIQSPRNGQVSVQIFQARPEHSGIYTLEVSNAFGMERVYWQVQVKECQGCKEHTSVTSGDRKLSGFNLESMTTKASGTSLQYCQREFLQYINSFMNGIGGHLIIHVVDSRTLGQFDMGIDERLKSLIPDGCFFHEIFDRYMEDKNHVCFHVKTQGYPRWMSTLDFCTKTSLNKGKDNPNHVQMRRLLQNVSSERSSEDDTRIKHKVSSLKEGEKVSMIRLQNARVSVPLHESVRIQAKGTKTRRLEPENERSAEELEREIGEDLAERHWEKKDKKLAYYIAAFSKIAGGGSYYIGIREKKSEFFCEGCNLTSTARAAFEERVKKKVSEEMLWYGTASPVLENPIEIKFHPVEQSPTGNDNLCVIEVKINHFRGLAFTTKEGPLMYDLKNASTLYPDGEETSEEEDEEQPSETIQSGPIKVSVEDWIALNLNLKKCSGPESDIPVGRPLKKCTVTFPPKSGSTTEQ